MQTIWNIAAMSVRLRLQYPAGYLTTFVMPLILMLILGAAINNTSSTLRLDVVNQDPDGQFSADFIAQLEDVADDTSVLVCVYGSEDLPDACNLSDDAQFTDVGQERLEEGNAAAAVIIPANFSDRLQNGQSVNLSYRADTGLNSSRGVRNTGDTALGRGCSSIAVAQTATNVASDVLGAYEGEDDPARQEDFDQLLATLRTELTTQPAVVDPESTGFVIGTGTNQSVPGTATLFVLISLLNAASDLILERKRGTLQRLMVVPTARRNILLGKMLGFFLFGVIQFVIFIIIGALLGVSWGTNFLAIGLVVVSFCLAGTALGFLLSTFVDSVEQASGIALLMSLTLAPLGGAWWPLDIVPNFMKTVGMISPVYYAMQGFTEIIYYDSGVLEVLPFSAVLLAMTAVFTGLAVTRFQYES